MRTTGGEEIAMPELPDRPDIDQLRRQARDLYRAAAVGEPDARARVFTVSDRIALSTAQLAVAREYGHPSWPALQAEVSRRRALLAAPSPQSPSADTPGPGGWLDLRYSFGGGAAIQTAEGVMSPEVLTVGSGHAELHASGVVYAQEPFKPVLWRSRREQWPRPSFCDLTGTDDKGAAYALRFGSGSLHFARPGEAPQRSDVSFWVDPVPRMDASWIELRAQNGSATRLAPSPRAAVRVGDLTAVSAGAAAARSLEELAYHLLELRHSNPFQDLSRQRAHALARAAEIQLSGELDNAAELSGQLARLCDRLTDMHLADELPGRWNRFFDALNQADGPERYLDLTAAVPRVEGLAVQLDHFVSTPDSWQLYLRAMPTWWGRSEDGHRKWALASVRADDDQGGQYLSTFGGSTGHRDHEELKLKFVPRIDPLARSLQLTFSSGGAEAAVDLDLAFIPEKPAVREAAAPHRRRLSAQAVFDRDRR
jgi:hypothetical protein